MKDELHIRVECLRPEQLIRRALDEGIVFLRIERAGSRCLLLDLTSRDAAKLLNICARFSIAASVMNRRGISRFRETLRKRATLIPAALLFAVICGFILSRLWFIDVVFTGPQAALGDHSAVYRALESCGIHPGISARTDTGALSARLASSLEGLSYISAKAQGVRLLVEAAPEIPDPEVYALTHARDLCSAVDGVVVSVEVYSGAACVRPGDTVRRGQLLIRGEEKASAGETRAIGALGEVIVRTWYEGSASLSLQEKRLAPTGRTGISARLQVMDFSLSLSECDPYALYSARIRRVPVGGLFLPVEIVREDRAELREVVARADLETLSDRLNILSMADAAANLSLKGPESYEPVQSWIRYDDTEEGLLKAHAVYEIYTNAAVTRRALLQGG